MIVEDDKKITPKAWEKELSSLQKEFEATKKPYSDTVLKLVAEDVLEHNRTDLDRMLGNESRAAQRQMVPKHKNREEILWQRN